MVYPGISTYVSDTLSSSHLYNKSLLSDHPVDHITTLRHAYIIYIGYKYKKKLFPTWDKGEAIVYRENNGYTRYLAGGWD